MKTRKSRPVPPANFWRLHRSPKGQRKATGQTAIQSVGLAADGSVVCCGVYYDDTLSLRALWRHATNWQRWRKWYDRLPWNTRADYPAKHSPRVTHWCAYPVNNPRVSISLALPTA